MAGIFCPAENRMTAAALSLSSLQPAFIVSLLVGIALLLFGRRLFWLFVGAVGFIAGLEWGATILGKQPETTALLFALALGVGCALLALAIQRIAVAIAGGIVGGMFAIQLASAAGFAGQTNHLIAFLLGALVAALLISLLFDWALIVLSSLAGGSLLAELVLSGRSLEMIVALVLCIVGIVFQARGGASRS